jgi:superfamily II DNA helicase RecQ
VSDREVDSALRVLSRSGALLGDVDGGDHALVRLLVTPSEVRDTLGASPSSALELLRALWRAHGDALRAGVVADLAALPPGLGAGGAIGAVLDELAGQGLVHWERREAGTWRLADRTKPLDDFTVDWQALDARRRGETEKLDTMQKYAYTNACRRHFVLRYFGDPAARTLSQCGGCDNCLGDDKPFAVKEGAPPRSRRAAPATSRGDARSESRGASRGTRTDARPSRPVAAPAAELDEDESALFEALRAWRSRTAADERVPAYVVFADRTLAAVASMRPRTKNDLLDVPGIGPAKLEKYGDAVLAILRGQ